MERIEKSYNSPLSQDPLNLFSVKDMEQANRKLEVRRLYDQRETMEKSVEVFWGEQMEVLLPEEISSSLYCKGHIEPRLSSFLFRFLKAGDVFLDVGAHMGYFSRLAANRVGPTGKVIAFEPMPTTFQWLSKNTSGRSQISIVNSAAWKSDGQIEFQDYGFQWSAYSSALEARLPKEFLKTLTSRKVQVQTLRLDDFVLKNHIIPSVIKIDAESTELLVLQGMEEYLLKEIQPVITLEVGDLDVPEAVLSRDLIVWLMERSYQAYEYQNDRLEPHRLRDRYEYDNLIFIPQSRIADLSERVHIRESSYA